MDQNDLSRWCRVAIVHALTILYNSTKFRILFVGLYKIQKQRYICFITLRKGEVQDTCGLLSHRKTGQHYLFRESKRFCAKREDSFRVVSAG
ncbi:hypothetical protein Plhal304r1_c030g0098771 [Plasmopara halstedii]